MKKNTYQNLPGRACMADFSYFVRIFSFGAMPAQHGI
jgi:hypothetical protein